MYMATTYSRKLKAENNSGNQEDMFGLCYAQHIDTNKPLLAIYVEIELLICLMEKSLNARWLKAMILSPHSSRVEDFLLCKKLVAQMRDIIVWENKTE